MYKQIERTKQFLVLGTFWRNTQAAPGFLSPFENTLIDSIQAVEPVTTVFPYKYFAIETVLVVKESDLK